MMYWVIGYIWTTMLTPLFLTSAPPFFYYVTGDQVNFLIIQAVKSEWSTLKKSNFLIPVLVLEKKFWRPVQPKAKF